MYGVGNCRVCLQDTSLDKCFSLFKSFEDSTISEQIKCVANVEISEGDGFPDTICTECFWQLGTAIAFKRKCEVSDKVLRCVQLNQIPIEYNDSDYISISYKDEDEISVKEETETEVDNELEDHSTEYSDTQLKTENEIETVFKKSRSIDLKLICDDCQGSFKSKCKLKVHWKKVHLTEKLTCKICRRIFKSYKAFNKHVKQKSINCTTANAANIEGQGKHRVFHCKQCSFKTKRTRFLYYHVAIHTGEKTFQCNICLKKFAQQASLIVHKDTHSQIKIQIICHVCGKTVKGRRNIYRHKLAHKTESYECDICKKTLKHKQSIVNHMKRHSGIKGYSCEKCSISFYTLSELCQHKNKVHIKTKVYTHKCDLCEFVTCRREALVIHKSKHTGSNFPCLICGNFFDNPEKFSIHLKSHTERNHACTYCDKRYATRHSRNAHVHQKHPLEAKKEFTIENTIEKEFACTICGNRYSIKASRTAHVHRKHKSKETKKVYKRSKK